MAKLVKGEDGCISLQQANAEQARIDAENRKMMDAGKRAAQAALDAAFDAPFRKRRMQKDLRASNG